MASVYESFSIHRVRTRGPLTLSTMSKIGIQYALQYNKTVTPYTLFKRSP